MSSSQQKRQKSENAQSVARDTKKRSEPKPEPKKRVSAARATELASLSERSVAGGRVSFDTPEDQFVSGLGAFASFSNDSFWRLQTIDESLLKRVTPARLMELCVDMSPEMSRALWDFILMFNPGYTLDAFKPGTETADENANAYLKQCLSILTELYGAPDVLFNRLAITGWMRGSFDAELVLADNARDFVDIATLDPAFLTYKKIRDPVRGVVWQVGQWQAGEFVRLDDLLTFRHVPIHPLGSKPQGRPLASSALFVSVFLMSLLQDLKRVIQRQGYPRIDLEVIFDKLKSQMPKDAQNNPDKLRAWADSVVASVKRVYATLKPENAYIHSDAVKVNQPVGALSNSSLSTLDQIFKALERMATRALKTMPLLMATTDGVSEANANRQWEIHAAGIKSLQHLCETLLEHLFKIALRAQGMQADVQFRFAELRAAELLRDAQVQLLQVTIARALYDNGLISQDEQAKLAIDKDKADAPEPRNSVNVTSMTPGGSLQQEQTQAQGQNPEPGANRDAMQTVRSLAHALLLGTSVLRQSPTLSQVHSAVNLWQQFAPDVAVDAATAANVS